MIGSAYLSFFFLGVFLLIGRCSMKKRKVVIALQEPDPECSNSYEGRAGQNCFSKHRHPSRHPMGWQPRECRSVSTTGW